MAKFHELILSASDAEVLALMLGERRRAPTLEAAATDALADLLLEARLVSHERLPADRVAMSSKVTYEEGPGGERRSVILVHPIEAFERLIGLANDVGLLAEEYDPLARRQLGNFPQAFSHVAMVNSAMNLCEGAKPVEQRAERKVA